MYTNVSWLAYRSVIRTHICEASVMLKPCDTSCRGASIWSQGGFRVENPKEIEYEPSFGFRV